MPTIGVRFALINKVQNKWIPYYNDQLKSLGINLTNERHKIITDYADAKTIMLVQPF
ncbi:MAG: hypothetical protein AB8U25_05490 [Rickettsiales endosymbiont of Dermacentor nuttalli]